jgi:hypothetical protein
MQTLCRTPLGRLRAATRRLPRLSGWLLITLALMLAVLVIAPHQLPVSLYKLSLVSLAGVVGYWLDRSLFPYARPDVFLQLEATEAEQDEGPNACTLEAQADDTLLRLMGLAMLRRAIIVAAAMVAMGLGA